MAQHIPLFLQDQIQKEGPTTGGSGGGDTASTSPGGNNSSSTSTRRSSLHHPRQRGRGSSIQMDPHKTFTATQLEDLLWKTSQTIVDVQKQIQRGEETYYEETQTHGGSSLFRGFETFIDARTNNNNDPSSSTSFRRMPGDYRWCSSSCANIARHMKQKLFVPIAPTTTTTTTDTSATTTRTTTAPLSGQKRSATADEEDPNPKPTKEARVPSQETTETKTKRNASTTAADQKQRRTTRKRKSTS